MAAVGTLVRSREIAPTTMVGRAVCEKRPMVANDSQSDPDVLFRDKYAQAGVLSIAVVPLLVSGEAVGALALYAGEQDFFHEDEMTLLGNLSRDIAFAIDYFGKRDRLQYMAFYDDVTGLANRSLFLDRVGQYVRSASGQKRPVAVGVLDIERFKNINHTLGRAAGDVLLVQVSRWLKGFFGDAHLLARVDADHFAFVRTDISQEREVSHFAETLAEEFAKQSFVLDGAVLRVAAKMPAVRIAVKVSPLQWHNPRFVGEIRKAIDSAPNAADGLELGITETAIMSDLGHSTETLQQIHDMGAGLAIDDFGTWFSSLRYLAKLPVDALKIDRSFVADMTSGPRGLALLSTMIGLGRALNLKPVAEGVETEEEARLLRLLRCDEMQGALSGKPVRVGEFEAEYLALGLAPSNVG